MDKDLVLNDRDGRFDDSASKIAKIKRKIATTEI
jgi:hypothetical protein